ncbi:MAG: hypothetical protein KGH59_03140 [Candidatus Micrarchaeota archaeon]|nr:hypothetical protein [Candidatus Micrarchaeota archaeon]
MATNPEELLIFKMRGIQKKPEKKEEKPAEKEELPAIVKPVGLPEVEPKKPSFFQKPAEQPKPVPRPQPVIEQPKAVPKPAAPAQVQKPIAQPPQQPTVAPAGVGRARVELEKKAFGSIFAAPQKEKQTAHETQVMVEEARRKPLFAEEKAATATPTAKIVKNAREQRQAAKDQVCLNHPWRPAYAICDFCERPFCYADMMEYGGRYYCLQDIDRVSGKHEAARKPANIFTIVAAMLFFGNAIIIGYFTAPQLGFLSNFVSSANPNSLLSALNASYTIQLFNLGMILLCVMAGILLLILGSGTRAFYSAGVIGTVILITISSEYLNSNYSSTILIETIISLLDIVFLAYGNMSAATVSYSTDIGPVDIEWPRVEAV